MNYPPIRKRIRPVGRKALYGEYTALMLPGEHVRANIRDRAAYLYATGNLPTHLRPTSVQILNQISRSYRRPASLSANCGSRKLSEEAVRDLRLETHPMVQTVRAKIAEGFLVYGQRSFGERRSYKRVLMFSPPHQEFPERKLTVTLEGATKLGWP